MKLSSVVEHARSAVRAHPDRAATAILHDSPDARMIVFHLAPGQTVAAHTSPSTVQLTVIHGAGFLDGREGELPTMVECSAGDTAIYAPNELHGMRAVSEELILLATITPRPGTR